MESKYTSDRILMRIDSLLKHIDQVLEDTKGLTLEELKNSNLLLRATCFSISQIGEMMNQLEKSLCDKYKDLPWLPARKMRNIIVHDYVGIDVEQIFSTIRGDLPALKSAFQNIRKDLVSKI